MKYIVITPKRFNKDLKRCMKRGQNDTQLTLLFLQTGTHADLF